MDSHNLCLPDVNPKLKLLPPFKHSPLDLSQTSIRLLDVLPRQRQEQGLIRCRIRHVYIPTTRDDLVYTALSYEWGDPTRPLRSIEVEGKRLDIQENLYDFLETHGELGIPNLWVDALCINQDDILEKNHQVRHMKDIYEQASKVIIWLGPEKDGSDEVFDFLGSSTMQKLDYTTFTKMRREDSSSRLKSIQQEIFSARSNVLRAAHQVCQRTYWTRTWIVQEVLLGHRVELTCGMKQASWISWLIYIEAFARVPEDTMDSRYWRHRSLILGVRHSPALTLCGQWQTNVDTTISTELVSLVLAFAQTDCARLHDKVYAFLGLASDAHKIDVDYSLPAEDLLVALLTTVTTSPSDDDIFALCSLFNVSAPHLTLSIDLCMFTAEENPIYPSIWTEQRGQGESSPPGHELKWRQDYRHSFQISQRLAWMLFTRSYNLPAKDFIQQYGSLSGFWPPDHPDRAKAAILENGKFRFSSSQPLPVDTKQWNTSGKSSTLVCLCVRCMKLNLVSTYPSRLKEESRLWFYTIPIADDVKYRTYFIFFGDEYVATGTQSLISWHGANNYWSDMTLFYDPVSLDVEGFGSIQMSTRQILNLVAHQGRSHDGAQVSREFKPLIGALKVPFCAVEKDWNSTWMQRQLQERRITEFTPKSVPSDVQGGATERIYGYDLLFFIHQLSTIRSYISKFSSPSYGDELRSVLLWAVKSGWDAFVQRLVKTSDNQGKTTLLHASWQGEDTNVQLLLDKGANIEATDQSGWTPLLGASANGRDTTVELLLDKGANIEATDKRGRTALIAAVEGNKDTTVQLLLDKGANIEATDMFGRTALRWAKTMRSTTIIDLLLVRGAKELF